MILQQYFTFPLCIIVPSLGEDKQALLGQHHGGILNDGFLVAVFGSMFLVSFAVQTNGHMILYQRNQSTVVSYTGGHELQATPMSPP